MLRLVFGAAALALTVGSAQAASTVFFDDFETEAPGANQLLTNWSIATGAIDVLGGGYFPTLCLNGTLCIDLDGSTGVGGRIETTTFAFVAGGSYTLSFDYGSNDFNSPNGNSMTFGITGGLFNDALGPISQPSVSFLSYSQTFTAIGSGSLFFDDDGNDLGGVILDNIRLTATLPGTAVPLPAGAVLGLTALGALAGVRVRTRRTHTITPLQLGS